MRLVGAGIGALLICLFTFALTISNYARTGGSASMRAAAPIVDQGRPPPAAPAQAGDQPAPTEVPPDNQVPAEEAASEPVAVPLPPARQPLQRSQPQLAAPAHHGKHGPKSDAKDDSSNGGD